MKIVAMAIMALMTGEMAAGKMRGAALGQEVAVCIAGGDARIVPSVLPLAQYGVTKIFESAGVRLVWRQGPEGCPAQGILIRITENTPEDLKPGALAYAEPRNNAIRVFYDRVEAISRVRTPVVFGYVLAHEITHVLQGIVRHSDSGIMKAHWVPADFMAMMWHRVNFEEVDVDLIQRGLAARIAADGLIAAAQ